MAAQSIGSATISFGLVSIPVRLYVATHSERFSFNMLHRPCGKRIKEQLFCPHCERTALRSEIAQGYEFSKDRSVSFTDDELKGLGACPSAGGSAAHRPASARDGVADPSAYRIATRSGSAPCARGAGRFSQRTHDSDRLREAEASRAIDIHEFVPLAAVDPIYFENAHYLAPDKGAEKAYHK